MPCTGRSKEEMKGLLLKESAETSSEVVLAIEKRDLGSIHCVFRLFLHASMTGLLLEHKPH